MSTLDITKPLPVDVSCFLILTSLQLDRIALEDGTLPGALQEFNGIRFPDTEVIFLFIRHFLAYAPFSEHWVLHGRQQDARGSGPIQGGT
jgi:hypothetical protein